MKKTYLEKLSELNDYSVWTFTKQETNFDESFKSIKLFSEIPNLEESNIEDYFTSNHARYDIKTNRHRILIISQLYGLLTKTPFYARGSQYKTEKPTEIFHELNKYEIGSYQYNVIKTEQLLKLKIHAIIDTTDNNTNYNVLPVIFIFQVLRKLKEKHGINSLNKDLLFTYVMTAANYSELDEVVDYIVSGGKPYENVKQYYDLSRVLTSITNNINLFIVTRNEISINPMYEDYFYDNFIKSYDIEEMHENLYNDIDYAQFLYFHQEFNINLIDEIVGHKTPEVIKTKTLPKAPTVIEWDDERDYIKTVDSIKEEDINENIAKDAHKIVPNEIKRKTGRKFKINPLLGKIAISKANYLCEFAKEHETFRSKRTGKNFLEGHHLVPVSKQIEIWEQFSVNVDCVENIISLCPNCHRAIHYGDNETKNKMIEKLFEIRKEIYRKIGLELSLDDIKKMYGVK